MSAPSNRVCAAFTLIEMMVVVALIGILIGGMFRLLGVVASNANESTTVQRIQRVENALSGFYAEYGSFPPVASHGLDGIQPMGFEFPTPRSMDEYIRTKFLGQNIYSANINVGAFDPGGTETAWENVKLFKFGVMSFLLPRVQVIGSGLVNMSENDPSLAIPHPKLFDKLQWHYANKARVPGSGAGQQQTFASQNAQESVCKRWMPHLEGIVSGGITLFGINICAPHVPYPQLSRPYAAGKGAGDTGNRHVLASMTVTDGWGHELYYYSVPPYQSYRIWSAGPDGLTVLPSTPAPTPAELKAMKDDIGRSR